MKANQKDSKNLSGEQDDVKTTFIFKLNMKDSVFQRDLNSLSLDYIQ